MPKKHSLLLVTVSSDGKDLYLHEGISKGMIEKMVKKLKDDYGLKLKERCRSKCG